MLRTLPLLIFQITAVLAFRPHIQTQKWLSCSVQNLEMFSCIFSCEEDTAQSIIDPTSALIELNNAKRPSSRRTAGLLDITEEQLPSVEVTFLDRLFFGLFALLLKGHRTCISLWLKQMSTERACITFGIWNIFGISVISNLYFFPKIQKTLLYLHFLDHHAVKKVNISCCPCIVKSPKLN